MKKTGVKKLARKLGWKTEQVEIALAKLLREKSIIEDWEEFIRTCLNAKDIAERLGDINRYLLKKTSQYDLIEIMCEWLYDPDPAFSVLGIFNIADSNKQFLMSSFKWSGSFINKLHKPGLSNPQLIIPRIDLNPELDPIELCHEFLGFLIIHKEGIEGIDIQSVLPQLISKVGFMAFNIRFLREQASWYSENPMLKAKAVEIASALVGNDLSSSKQTQRRHWSYYVLVEKFKEELGLTRAFREVAKRLNVPIRTIDSRYFTQKKKVKSESLTLEKIIEKYQLRSIVNHYLEGREDP